MIAFHSLIETDSAFNEFLMPTNNLYLQVENSDAVVIYNDYNGWINTTILLQF